TKIKGINPDLAARLLQLNCTKFDQIANFSDDDIANVEEALSLDGDIQKNDWIGQARALVTEATAGEAAAG
ncbi:MAG: 50S ribosomal protein L19, partial [Proteobacteria bacterium]|nr:50S ribosomal protein L19 [Pseudomonadota bacterium]